MVKFILNNKSISTETPTGMTLLDFVRYEKNLVGTKIGCREGDCGACTILVGDLIEGQMVYKSVTSCITPLGNVAGKHVVSIEGLNMDHLSPVQQAMLDESGTQCGFCTVGFVVSFSGVCLTKESVTYDEVISAIDGNICRCTGYKSIERAAKRIHSKLKNKDMNNPIDWLVENKFIPNYFSGIAERVTKLDSPDLPEGEVFVGGGTDLYVQKHDSMEDEDITFVSDQKKLKGITLSDNVYTIGAANNAQEMMESEILQGIFPNLWNHIKLISSTPIRNLGTLAGNFINASPIGDLTAYFIGLNSSITLRNKPGNERTILLKDLYKGYKDLDKAADEYIVNVQFKVTDAKFNFEKISKRTYLDIASVNSAMLIKTDNNTVIEVNASAGGVGPTPLFLSKTCEFLKGKTLSMGVVAEAVHVMQGEVAPISDARGTEEYKRLALKQLFFAHFVELFPETFKEEILV